jgi:hypothetical protein
MENYTLRDDETVLFKNEVKVCTNNKKFVDAELLLTNLNFVFIYKKKFFGKSMENEVFDAKSVKIYDSTYQIIRKNKTVAIYMIGAEKTIEFPSLKLAKEFSDVALRLVSGFSKLVRGVKKAQKAVNETEDALDIDIKKAIKTSAVTVGTVAINVANSPIAGKKTKLLGTIAKSILHAKNAEETKQLTTSTAETEE